MRERKGERISVITIKKAYLVGCKYNRGFVVLNVHKTQVLVLTQKAANQRMQNSLKTYHHATIHFDRCWL
jgi:hypothetical protein